MFRTLVVEDEAIIRKGLIATFDWMAAGCVVIGEAQSGSEGLEKIRQMQPDLVITDICMYDMDGLEMIEKGNAYCSFYSIVLTGYSEFEFARRAVSLHVFAYLLKPIDRDELMNTILTIHHAAEEKKSNTAAPSLDNAFDTIYSRQMDKSVRYTLDQIKEHYTKKLQLEKIAKDLFVSKNYLSKKIHDETNHTFTELLYQYRIQKAVALLNLGTYRINEIATMTGFHDYKHFNSVFKKYLHQSPSEYLNSPARVVFR